MWLGIGVVVGLGLGVVLFTPSNRGDDVVTAEPASPRPPAALDGPESSTGIADVITGFPDAIVGVVTVEGGSLAHIVWPVAGDPVVRALPGGTGGTARFDSSGTWLALTTDVPDLLGEVLSVGKPSTVQPLASGVTSYSWHDSEAGRLGYTQVEDGEWQLLEVGASREPEVIRSSDDTGGRLLAWGEWGWAVHDMVTGEGVSLLGPSGELRASPSGVVLDSHPAGWLLMGGDRLNLVSSGGGVKGIDVSVDSLGTIVDGEISPDGEWIAVLGANGLKVFREDGTGEVFQAAGFGSTELVWTSDSRFVLIPGSRGVVVTDTQGTPPEYVLANQRFVTLGVIPLTSSRESG